MGGGGGGGGGVATLLLALAVVVLGLYAWSFCILMLTITMCVATQAASRVSGTVSAVPFRQQKKWNSSCVPLAALVLCGMECCNALVGAPLLAISRTTPYPSPSSSQACRFSHRHTPQLLTWRQGSSTKSCLRRLVAWASLDTSAAQVGEVQHHQGRMRASQKSSGDCKCRPKLFHAGKAAHCKD